MTLTTTTRDDHEPPRGLLDSPAVADWLGVTVRHVRRLVTERRIPYIKVGRLIRFDPVEIERWIDESRRPPQDQEPGR